MKSLPVEVMPPTAHYALDKALKSSPQRGQAGLRPSTSAQPRGGSSKELVVLQLWPVATGRLKRS